jgi:hypothetical protein
MTLFSETGIIAHKECISKATTAAGYYIFVVVLFITFDYLSVQHRQKHLPLKPFQFCGLSVDGVL